MVEPANQVSFKRSTALNAEKLPRGQSHNLWDRLILAVVRDQAPCDTEPGSHPIQCKPQFIHRSAELSIVHRSRSQFFNPHCRELCAIGKDERISILIDRHRTEQFVIPPDGGKYA